MRSRCSREGCHQLGKGRCKISRFRQQIGWLLLLFLPPWRERMDVSLESTDRFSSNAPSWTKYLPLNAFDTAAKLLLDFGILEKAHKSGAVEFGMRVEEILRAPFQRAFTALSYGQRSLPVPPPHINGAQRLACMCMPIDVL